MESPSSFVRKIILGNFPTLDSHPSENEQYIHAFFKRPLGYGECSFFTDEIEQFDAHLEHHYPDYDLNCLFCFGDDSELMLMRYSIIHLLRHIMKRHSHCKYQCNLCFFRGVSINHASVHQFLNHPDDAMKKILIGRPILNSYQPPDFYQFMDLNERKIQIAINTGTFKICLYCETSFTLIKHLAQHILQVHPGFGLNYIDAADHVPLSDTNSEWINTQLSKRLDFIQ